MTKSFEPLSDVTEYINTATCFDHASLLSRTNLHYTTIPNIFPRWNGKKDIFARIYSYLGFVTSICTTPLLSFQASNLRSFHSLFFFFLPFSDKSYRRSSARASRKWKLIRRISILPRIQSRINSAGFVPTTLRIDFRYCDVRIKGSKSNRSSPPPSPRFGYVYFFSNGYDPLPGYDPGRSTEIIRGSRYGKRFETAFVEKSVIRKRYLAARRNPITVEIEEGSFDLSSKDSRLKSL